MRKIILFLLICVPLIITLFGDLVVLLTIHLIYTLGNLYMYVIHTLRKDMTKIQYLTNIEENFKSNVFILSEPLIKLLKE